MMILTRKPSPGQVQSSIRMEGHTMISIIMSIKRSLTMRKKIT